MVTDDGVSLWIGEIAWSGQKLRMGDDGELPLEKVISIHYLQVLYPSLCTSSPLFYDFWTR